MRRLLIGVGSLLFLLVTVILAVPFFLPKDAIKQQVIAEVERTAGWRLRLDGPVSLSLVPGFALTAEDVGLSGEAGADGIEFARAEKIAFGLAWSGLFGGEIRVTRVFLNKPDILLEIASSGLTSWAPRKDLTPAEEAAEILNGQLLNPEQRSSADETQTAETGGSASARSLLSRLGVDALDIDDGTLVYHDRRSGVMQSVSDLNLSLSAPDLTGDVTLDSAFLWQGLPSALKGSLTNPIGLMAGEQVPVDLTLSIEDNSVGVAGQFGLQPARLDLAISAMGPSLQEAVQLAGAELPGSLGAFSIFTKLSGDEASISLSDLSASAGSFGFDGQADANLQGNVPVLSGRFVLRDSGLEDLLTFAGQPLSASGIVSGDVAFEASGLEPEALLATLDLRGALQLKDGEITGLGLAEAVGGDEAADRLSDIGMELQIAGLDQAANLRGNLVWRGEPFTATGTATPAPLFDGQSAPVSVQIKSNRVTAGFDGSTSATQGLEGAVSIKTDNLRALLAWMGQSIDAGSGLGRFEASGVLSADGREIAFEETRFVLDETSGEANGRLVLADRPSIDARLALNSLVLDPYLSRSSTAQGGQGGSGAQTGTEDTGWSDAPIDFSGLNAADVNFAITTQDIRWDKIQIDESALSAQIKDGVLTANLDRLTLYGGQGTGEIVLNGSGGLPQIQARLALNGLNAYPLLSDAADFGWLEGSANIAVDVATGGGSQRALIQGLEGTASYDFTDGAIRGLNIPKMVRGLSVETLLGWQDVAAEKTDFSSLTASFEISDGVARTSDVSLIGPLIRMTGSGTTHLPDRTLDWRLEPKVVASLEGQAPTPRAKGEDQKLAGLGVPVIVRGSWSNPRIYPDIAGILENPEAAYKQLEAMGGELTRLLKDGRAPQGQLVDAANDAINRATGGRTQIDVQKVIEGEVDDKDILKAVEDGFGLPSGFLGSFGRKENN